MSHPTLPPLAERVAQGAALLDQREPGWYEAIAPDELGWYQPGRTLLDHLAARFYDDDVGAALATLSYTFTSLHDPLARAWLVAHGFALANGEHAAAQLGDCWHAEIRRRAGQPPTATPPRWPNPAGAGDLLGTLRGLLTAPELSLAAKAILVLAVTRPAGQVLTWDELVGLGRDARWQVDAALAELVEDGWLEVVEGGYLLRTDPDNDPDGSGGEGSL